MKKPRMKLKDMEMRMQKKEAVPPSSVDDKSYLQWKSLIPFLYDWITNHKLVWPTLSCRWGSHVDTATYKNFHRLYLSERTDGTVPDTLLVANCQVVKPYVAPAEHICQFNEESRSPFITNYKKILHPGEVTRIRELPQNINIVATHSDFPQVFIWDVNTQPNRKSVPGARPSFPDLVLTGHTDSAEFALAMCPTEPFVLSGGRDKSVVLWSIHDQISTLATEAGSNAKESSKPAKDSKKPTEFPSVGPRGIFQGHTDTVEDVQFCPSSPQEFCSVGDDSCIIFWDARVGTTPVVKVQKAHLGDLHCVDWSPFQTNFLLTGSDDTQVRLFDRRKLSSAGNVGNPVFEFEGHDAALVTVQWCPDKETIFGSAAEDGILNIWDLDKTSQPSASGDEDENEAPLGLMFRHRGHRDKMVDFQWNRNDPWTIVSVSDDCESCGGGGTLQIWRMIHILYEPEEEVADDDEWDAPYDSASQTSLE